MSLRSHVVRAVTAASVAAVLAASLVPLAASASSTDIDAAKTLAGLTSDQRQALKALDSIKVDPLNFGKGTLDTSKPAHVIVSFRQQPAKVARLIAATDGVDLSPADATQKVANSHKRFKADLRSIYGTDAPEVTAEFSTSFNGAALTLPADQVKKLLDSGQVQSVWPDATARAYSTVASAGASDVTTTASTRTVQQGIEDGIAKLHADGITGKGVKVGIIDTGIDYNHPDLKAVYKGGYDFVDNDSDPMETTYADWKASKQAETSNGETYYTEHGTHVAGIIAGQGTTPGSAQGIAPGASVYSYRVLGPYGSGATSTILKGMDRAVSDGMNVVNMSLGAASDDPMSPEAIAADDMVLSGVVTVIAAGNSGSGAFTVGTPGAAALPITVGANDYPIDLPAVSVAVDGKTIQGRLLGEPYGGALDGLAGGTFSLFDAKSGNTSDYAGTSPQGKVAVIRRGSITLNQKVQYAKQRGAVAVLLVNDAGSTGHIPAFLGADKSFIPTYSVTDADGAALYGALADGNVSVSFTADGTLTFGDGTLASFSSRGPVSGSMAIKPEVTAPGVSVLSSIPADVVDPTGADYTHAYAYLSGTSMATPYVVGVAALALQQDKSRTTEDIKVALMNTAVAPPSASSVYDVGAGQVDPLAAVTATRSAWVDATTRVEQPDQSVTMQSYRTGALDFGSVASGKGASRSATIEVAAPQPTKYNVTVDFTRGSGTSLDAASNGIALTANNSTVNATANGSKVKLSLSVPTTAAKGVYEGEIELTAAGRPGMHIPFALRVSAQGFEDVNMAKSVVTNRQGQDMSLVGQATNGQASFSFELAGQLDHMDIVMADARGDDIGIVGTLNTIGLLEDRWYGYVNLLGQYYPFTGDKADPIGNQPVWATQGAYTLKLIGTDADGNTFQTTRPLYVDTTSPAYTDAFPAYSMAHPTVVRVPADATQYTMKAKLVDGQVADINATGIPISQADNLLYFTRYTGSPEGAWKPDADGNVNGAVTLGAGPSTGLRMWAADAAGNIAAQQQVTLVRDGVPYVVGDASQATARPGDVVTYSFTAHDTQAWSSYAMDLRWDPRMTQVLSVAKSDALAAVASGPITSSDQTVSSQTIRRVTVAMDDQANGVTAAVLPTFTVTFKVLDGPYTAQTGLYAGGVYVKSLNGGKTPQVVYPGTQYLNPTSSVTIQPAAQALLTPGYAFDYARRDYSQVGTTGSMTLADGTVVPLSFDAKGGATASGMPYSAGPAKTVVRTPGHFAWYQTIDLATHGSYGSAGQLYSQVPALLAGDVNGDGVIDVKDASAILQASGTGDRDADINDDGVVDSADLQWVITNWFARNHSQADAPVPVSKYKGYTLEKVIAAMP